MVTTVAVFTCISWQNSVDAVGANVCAVSGDSKLSSSSSYAAMEVAHSSVVEVRHRICDFMFYVILGPIPSVLGASKCMHKSIHIQFAPISKAASTTSSLIVISLSNILLSRIAQIICAACLHGLQCALYNFPLADRLCRTNYNGQTIPPIPINEYTLPHTWIWRSDQLCSYIVV